MVGAFLVLGRTMGNLDSQDSTQHGLGGSHHLPPYSILYASPRGPHPNGILPQDSQVGVPKFPKLGFPWFWGLISLRVDLGLRWGLKQSCIPHRDLSNGMSHATYTQGNRVDSRLLVVRSQIANSILDPFFGQNLCFRCPNEWCEPILDIYVSIVFQWYNELFTPLSFDPCNHSLNIRKSIGIPTPKMGVPLGV